MRVILCEGHTGTEGKEGKWGAGCVRRRKHRRNMGVQIEKELDKLECRLQERETGSNGRGRGYNGASCVSRGTYGGTGYMKGACGYRLCEKEVDITGAGCVRSRGICVGCRLGERDWNICKRRPTYGVQAV
ncbi:hypothetical protein GDO81_013787 [Engystomops pustulosus]|uniref:Uncharacterized protein n=1 Tax=Engystomops pustulosus TaxID=76066 RepID=A0AAV7B5M3_ENGPU|nr:hypothetical protein GDO81_013787 [Engystomops pustulosus]